MTKTSVPNRAMNSNNRVQLFESTTSKFLASVGRRGQIRPGRMQCPEGVAFVDGRREVRKIKIKQCRKSKLQYPVEGMYSPSLQPD